MGKSQSARQQARKQSRAHIRPFRKLYNCELFRTFVIFIFDLLVWLLWHAQLFNVGCLHESVA